MIFLEEKPMNRTVCIVFSIYCKDLFLITLVIKESRQINLLPLKSRQQMVLKSRKAQKICDKNTFFF